MMLLHKKEGIFIRLGHSSFWALRQRTLEKMSQNS